MPKDKLDLLRHLLVGEEIRLLEKLDNENKDTKQQVNKLAQYLPEAISVCNQNKKSRLVHHLSFSVKEVLKETVKTEPETISDALFPIMGPAIRKSIRETLKSMLSGFETALENSFSSKSLKWRFQAWRTDKPFSEVLLLNSLEYQVEQVFLIQHETGLLISHVQSEQAIIKDPDMISGMLTAIQDFISDSFVSNQEELSSMSLGDLTVRLYQGPKATLAVVIRGNYPSSQNEKLQENLEQLHLVFDETLQNYEGDTETANEVVPYLQDCLVSRFKTEQKKQEGLSPKIRFVLFALIMGLLYWIFNIYQENKQWQNLEQAIQQQAGWFLKEINQQQITIWRDPFAISITDFLNQQQTPLKNLNWQQQAFLSLDHKILEKRLKIVSHALPETSIVIKNNEIILSGKAKQAWLQQFRQNNLMVLGLQKINIQNLQIEKPKLTRTQILNQAIQILKPTQLIKVTLTPDYILNLQGEASQQWINQAKKSHLMGIKSINLNNVTNLDLIYQQVKKQIKSIHFYFASARSDRYTPKSIQVEQTIAILQNYFQIAKKLNINGKITLQAYTDNTGSYLYNQRLVKERGLFIYQQFTLSGINPNQLLIINKTQNNAKITPNLRKVSLGIIEYKSK